MVSSADQLLHFAAVAVKVLWQNIPAIHKEEKTLLQMCTEPKFCQNRKKDSCSKNVFETQWIYEGGRFQLPKKQMLQGDSQPNKILF